MRIGLFIPCYIDAFFRKSALRPSSNWSASATTSCTTPTAGPNSETGVTPPFNTGPSASADIEGLLMHGAQGVRSLSVLPLARGAGNPTH